MSISIFRNNYTCNTLCIFFFLNKESVNLPLHSLVARRQSWPISGYFVLWRYASQMRVVQARKLFILRGVCGVIKRRRERRAEVRRCGKPPPRRKKEGWIGMKRGAWSRNRSRIIAACAYARIENALHSAVTNTVREAPRDDLRSVNIERCAESGMRVFSPTNSPTLLVAEISRSAQNWERSSMGVHTWKLCFQRETTL